MPLALQVTLARPSDADDMADMSRRLIEHGLPWTWTPRRVSRAISAPNTNVAVVRDRDAIGGFAIMEHLENDAHLVLLAVEPWCRRQGLGRALVLWLEASARVDGATRVCLETRRDNDSARHFYNELGYHEVRIQRRRYGGRFDGIRLEKWLRTSRGV